MDILDEMGVLPKMRAAGVVHEVSRGGFISPSGHACINAEGSGTQLGDVVSRCRTYAIKRHLGDEFLARAAADAGAVLVESCEVATAAYDAAKGLWSVVPAPEYVATGGKPAGPFQGLVLLLADGSNSYMAQRLGIIPQSQPSAVCSHRWVGLAVGSLLARPLVVVVFL